MRKPLLGIVI